jgi:hypothetical protein
MICPESVKDIQYHNDQKQEEINASFL